MSNSSKSSTDTTTLTPGKLEELYTNIMVTANKAMQSGQGNIINIIKNYNWAVNAGALGNNKKIPALYVNEYRQNLSTFASSIKSSSTGTATTVKSAMMNTGASVSSAANQFNAIISSAGGHLSPYSDLYSISNDNCLKYVFPYFEQKSFSLANKFGAGPQSNGGALHNTLEEWVKTSGILGGFAEQINELKSIGDLLTGRGEIGDEGIYIEKPQYFQYSSNDESLTVNFVLYNTIKHPSDPAVPWQKNYQFIKNFALKNLPYKISFFSYQTPALYEVQVPGIKYFPISFISNFSATNLGVAHYLDLNGYPVLVPEAWNVSITFQSLLSSSANILQSAFGRGPIVTAN